MCNRFASSRILRGFSRDISVRYLSSRDDESCFLPHEIIAFCMRCTEKNRAGIYFAYVSQGFGICGFTIFDLRIMN